MLESGYFVDEVVKNVVGEKATMIKTFIYKRDISTDVLVFRRSYSRFRALDSRLSMLSAEGADVLSIEQKMRSTQ